MEYLEGKIISDTEESKVSSTVQTHSLYAEKFGYQNFLLDFVFFMNMIVGL